MARLQRNTKILGAILGALVLSGCFVDFGEKDIRQFAPLNDRVGVDGKPGPPAPPEGFFGGHDTFEGFL